MKSMTGFGRSEGTVGSSWFTVEVKSVNHRYQDIRVRLANILSQYEPKAIEQVRESFVRGSFEVSVRQKVATGDTSASGNITFQLDSKAGKSFIVACEEWSALSGQSVTPSLENVLGTGKIILPVEQSLDDASNWKELEALLGTALKDLAEMRAQEGERLSKILEEGVKNIIRLTTEMEGLASGQPEHIREKLTKRIAKWDLSSKADPQRLEWEIAYYAERSDITEEIHRLKCHGEGFLEMFQNDGPIGRKLDFLSQEMHREVNTMGSKSNLVALTNAAVEAKTQIEKLREQVQNVE